MRNSPVAGSRLLARLVREALAAGLSVELEGLGTFRPNREAGFLFERRQGPKVFIGYVREDAARANLLYEELARRGFDPWMDCRKLLPGQNWPRAIENAIEVSDFVVVCFSQRASSKKGGFQAELRYALECARRMPLEAVYLVPLRLDECRVPAQIARQVQYIDMFPDWEGGRRRLVRVLRGGKPGPVPKSARVTSL